MPPYRRLRNNKKYTRVSLFKVLKQKYMKAMPIWTEEKNFKCLKWKPSIVIWSELKKEIQNQWVRYYSSINKNYLNIFYETLQFSSF